MHPRHARPRIGLTMDIEPEAAGPNPRAFVRLAYLRAVLEAGGAPVPLAPEPALLEAQLTAIDGVILTGGDDPIMEEFGKPTHPAATPLHPMRQRYERALLEALDHAPDTPVLGVCLGMQLMALHAGGALDQHLPDRLPGAAEHWEQTHAITPEGQPPDWLCAGSVLSRHRQAITDPGRLRTCAKGHDGEIEAVWDPARRFYAGVQWHPERTEGALGSAIIEALVDAAGAGRASGLVEQFD